PRRTISWSAQRVLVRTARQGRRVRRFRWVRGVVVLGLAGALMGAVPGEASAVPARSRCRATAFVPHNDQSDAVSTVDVKTGTKNPTDIPVGAQPVGGAITPDGQTALVTHAPDRTVSTSGGKTRAHKPNDIP